MRVTVEKAAMWGALCATNAAIAGAVGSAVVDLTFTEAWALAIAAQIVITGSLLLDKIYDA